MIKEKQLLLDEVKEKISSSKAMIVTNYSKLEPAVSWELSNHLDKSNSFFEVVKKRVFIKAARESGFEIDDKIMEGHIGVVFIEGEVSSAAKSVYNFNKVKGDILRIVCGFFEGKIYSSNDVDVIAKLPPQDILRAQFLGLLEAPMAQTLSVMESVLSGVVYCLMNKSQNEK